MSKRRAIIRLSEQELHGLIQLPEGLRIIGVHDDWYMMGVQILIEGQELESVPDEVEPPYIAGRWEFDYKTHRAQWSPPWLDGQ